MEEFLFCNVSYLNFLSSVFIRNDFKLNYLDDNEKYYYLYSQLTFCKNLVFYFKDDIIN